MGPFGTMPQEPWHPKRVRRNAKPVPWSYQLREVRTSASLTARTVESLDHQEKYFSPYRRTIMSYFKYISIADLCSDLWLDKKKFFLFPEE